MRIASSILHVGLVVMAMGFAVACAAPAADGTPYGKGAKRTTGSTNNDGKDNGDNNPADTTPSDPASPAPSGTTTTPDPPATTPAEFCDDAKTIPGTKLLDDPLTTEKGLFTVAQGFSQTSWTYDGTALRQTRAVNEVDNLVFNKDTAIGDVEVEARAASTGIDGAITPRLRQMFIVMGAQVAANGTFSAVGCGVEVVQGEATEQKTSVVRFEGPPNAVTTQVLERVNRAVLQVDEQFTIKAKLSKGTLTCSVTQAATTTATANNLGDVIGGVGFFTRQTKSLFKNARICKLPK